MKWTGANLNAMRRMQWMLSMLAVVACLWSVGSVHSHDAGLHSQDSACISCDLEDVTSHGTLFSSYSVATENLVLIKATDFWSERHVTAVKNSAPIRAPPNLS